MSPRLVLKVASQTEVAEMHVGGALVNQTTRLVDPVAGGHVVSAAAVGGENVVTVLAVVVVVVACVVTGMAVVGGLLVEWLAAVVAPHAASASMLAPATAIIRTRRWLGGMVERFATMTLLFGSVRRGVEPAPWAAT
jgi:hypothetical protein